MLKGSESWSGFAGLSFGFVKNTTDNYNVSTNLAFGYNGGENLWMIISNRIIVTIIGIVIIIIT